MGLDQLAPPICGLGVPARLVEGPERAPELVAVGLVGLSGRAADRDDRRPRLLGERRPLDARAGEDECAGRRIDPLAVELEAGTAALNQVELLVLARLVVLVDDPGACLAARPGIDAEGRDAEVVPDRPRGTAPVADLVDLVKMRHCVTAHGTSCGSPLRGGASRARGYRDRREVRTT